MEISRKRGFPQQLEKSFAKPLSFFTVTTGSTGMFPNFRRNRPA